MSKDHESFRLTNPPPKRQRLDVPNTTGVQKVLFSGLQCFAGQKDLFVVDGPKATNMIGDKPHDDAPRA